MDDDVTSARLDWLQLQMDQRFAALEQRISDLRDAAAARAAASAEAIAKAEAATEKRFEGVNEFRKQLSDQTATFLPRPEYDVNHAALADKLNVQTEAVRALELRLTSRLDLGQGAQAGQRESRTERRLDVGTIIAAVAVIIAAISVAAFLLKK